MAHKKIARKICWYGDGGLVGGWAGWRCTGLLCQVVLIKLPVYMDLKRDLFYSGQDLNTGHRCLLFRVFNIQRAIIKTLRVFLYIY